MELVIYKGFDSDFLSSQKMKPLIETNISERKNIFAYTKDLKREFAKALLGMQDTDSFWITYEEYSFCKDQVDIAIKDYDLHVVIYVNNTLPDYYPIEFRIAPVVLNEIIASGEVTSKEEISDQCKRFLAIFNSAIIIGNTVYASFYNYEYEKGCGVEVKEYYPHTIQIADDPKQPVYNIYISEDVEAYLKCLEYVSVSKPPLVSYSSTDGHVAKRLFESLKAYCQHNGIQLYHYIERLNLSSINESDLIAIAREDVGIPDFKEFRQLKFYKNPDIDNETINISQAQIIQEIITQSENAYSEQSGVQFRDIFITAPTGAGKSVMFQIPAIYLAKRYGKLTIVIEPVKALMQDQKEQLNKRGYFRVEAFNSDLISQSEKEAVLKKVKDGTIDILYLSPETLLSYSIETLIGDREVGLLIVDEAHIVTTWGVGFRPDYWYLGGYINNMRNGVKTHNQRGRQHYRFPICAFTATAINGGIDDTISETIISLYMENPIKYVGYAKRENIGFNIVKCEPNRLANAVYEQLKAKSFASSIQRCIDSREKTIVYFPYASYASDAIKGIKSFAGTTMDRSKIGLYTGRNTDDKTLDEFKTQKQEAFHKFRSGENLIMFATKAFGMGVDIDDIKNVYHYAVTGNLSDYVQEIGRAARRASLHGSAVTDYYYNDLTFMQRLFGMSQIKQYQINLVLQGIYSTYKSKKNERNFLISPETFTYIFNGNSKDNDAAISKLKTCLLMLEKDFYDKYNFKVLISRPQGIFTKAFVVINGDHTGAVLESEFGKYFRFLCSGRQKERYDDNTLVTDTGDIYQLDLKSLWEDHYPDISFPMFKYWYFNGKSDGRNETVAMPDIFEYIAPRQKITIETQNDLLICDLKDCILEDMSFVADALYKEFGKSYFTKEEFARAISGHYGMTRARIIANSLFELIDPEHKCVKSRNTDGAHGGDFYLSNGILKELMRRPIVKSPLLQSFEKNHNSTDSRYMTLKNGSKDSIALKLLSVFGHITYEMLGGEEPEIFIRLNDPEKIRRIVTNEVRYTNDYVTRAKQKHERDVKILSRFFCDFDTDEDRWDYIERYFLGEDLLSVPDEKLEHITNLSAAIDREKSFQTTQYQTWKDTLSLFDDSIQPIITGFEASGIPLPEYLSTTIKKNIISGDIIMAWAEKGVLIFDEAISTEDALLCKQKGWTAYSLDDLDTNQLKAILS